MSIHHEVKINASVDRVYEVLTTAAQFAAATGRPATLDAVEGSTFSLFGGYIEGRQIELVDGQRVVQAWRGADWAPGVYSLVRFGLEPDGPATRLTVDHQAYPEGESPLYPSWQEHLSTNWPVFYFEPFSKYLAA